MKILGIESSCDETAAAVVEDGERLLSNVVNSQIDIHAHYGGVIPEIAARSHLEVVNPVIEKALSDANCTWDDIDAIAVTYAPGLIGSLLVGSLAARTLAILHSKPLYAIHHVEAHVYANFITSDVRGEAEMARQQSAAREGQNPSRSEAVATAGPVSTLVPKFTLPSKQPDFPMLALIVSGGHSQLVLFRDHGDYILLGQTQDDAVGEAYDKVAKILGLPYPGGPSIAKAAALGDSMKYQFPKANLKCTHQGAHFGAPGKAAPSSALSGTKVYREGAAQAITQHSAQNVCRLYDFSFSGLKTAVLRAVQAAVGKDYTFPSHELPELLDEATRNDFAASFQRVANETLVDKAIKAYEDYQPKSVVIAGGVAADRDLRRRLAEQLPIPIEYAPMQLCTDNAAMVAALGYFYAQTNTPVDPYTLEVIPSLSMTKTAWHTEAA